MAAEAATHEGGKTAGEYIIHHLHHLQVGSGFWTFNVDSIFWALVTGVFGCFVLFDGGVKKLCRYNQYFGVRAAQEVLRERGHPFEALL